MGPRQGQSPEAWEGGKHAGPVLGPGVFSSRWEEITYCPPESVFAVREVTAFPGPGLAPCGLHVWEVGLVLTVAGLASWGFRAGGTTSSLLGPPICILLLLTCVSLSPTHACRCTHTCLGTSRCNTQVAVVWSPFCPCPPHVCGAQGSAHQPPTGSQTCVHIADFWDTAGQERFQSMHASYYHKAHACIMVRDQWEAYRLARGAGRGPSSAEGAP